MKVGRRMTVRVKKHACAICKHCDGRALRKGWKHCRAKEPEIRDGQCDQFLPVKGKQPPSATEVNVDRGNG